MSEIHVPQRFLENHEAMYGKVNYDGRVVLDIGADYGSTANYFLGKGAKAVIAVEPDPAAYQGLVLNARVMGPVLPLNQRVTCGCDLGNLISFYQPDIVKLDCEGCEVALLDLEDEALTKPEAWVIEAHSIQLQASISERLRMACYDILAIDGRGIGFWALGSVKVITATRGS